MEARGNPLLAINSVGKPDDPTYNKKGFSFYFMKKNVCFVFVFLGVCSLFIDLASAEYFINTRTITSGEIVDTTTGTTTTVTPQYPIVFSPSRTENLLASGSTSGDVVLWNPEPGAVVRTLDRGDTYTPIGIHGLAFNADGSKIAAGGWDEKVYVWEVATGSLLHTLEHGDDEEVVEVVQSVAFTKDNSDPPKDILYSMDFDKVKRWSLPDGDADGTLDATHTTSTGNVVMVAKNIQLPSGNTFRLLMLGKADGGVEVRYASSFNKFVDSKWKAGFETPGTVITSQVWSIETVDPLDDLPIVLWSGHADGKIHVWKIDDRNSVEGVLGEGLLKYSKTLTEHIGAVRSIAYRAPRTACASADGTISVFTDGESNAYTIHHPDLNTTDNLTPRVFSGTWSPKGKVLASYAETWDAQLNVSDRNIRLWENRDANDDGQLTIDDFVAIMARYDSDVDKDDGFDSDLDGDGRVELNDLKLMAEAYIAICAVGAGAPILAQQTLPVSLDVNKVKQMLHDARQINADARVIAILEALLKEATLQQTMAPPPAKTALFTNYPNPFNPETWIPYELATPAEVTVDIHSATGQLVRTLRLGHQLAGTYRAQTRAAYWDGRNKEGETVASGVYFYTLKAGEFTATRKMLIRK